MTSRLFSQYDAWDLKCREDEVGTPWEPRFGNSDIKAGLCMPNMLGKPMPSAPTGEDDSDVEPPMLTPMLVQVATQRGISLVDAEALAYLALELDPEGFMRRNQMLYRDLIADQRQKRIAEASQAGKTKELTARQIDALYQADIARFVADVVIEVLPLKTLKDRHDALHSLLKITPEMLQELVE